MMKKLFKNLAMLIVGLIPVATILTVFYYTGVFSFSSATKKEVPEVDKKRLEKEGVTANAYARLVDRDWSYTYNGNPVYTRIQYFFVAKNGKLYAGEDTFKSLYAALNNITSQSCVKIKYLESDPALNGFHSIALPGSCTNYLPDDMTLLLLEERGAYAYGIVDAFDEAWGYNAYGEPEWMRASYHFRGDDGKKRKGVTVGKIKDLEKFHIKQGDCIRIRYVPSRPSISLFDDNNVSRDKCEEG